MSGTYQTEVAVVERGDVNCAVLFGNRDNERVRSTQRKRSVLLDKISGPGRVGWGNSHQQIDTVRYVAQEIRFGLGPSTAVEHVSNLGEERLRKQERSGEVLEEIGTTLMVEIFTVGVGDYRASVDNNHAE